MWAIATAPVDATAPLLTLATNLTPDSGTHTAVHLGLAAAAVTIAAKPKMEHIGADQADGPVDAYVPQMDMTIEAELEQLNAIKLQRALGVGTYSTASGYRQFTFGGTTTVPTICLAVISAQRGAPTKATYALLYKAAATGPLAIAFGRAKPTTYKIKFQGLSDLARVLGPQIGAMVKQLTAPVGASPTAKDYTPAEIQQGPANLWIVGTPPVDATPRLTLAADLTPDATAHPLSLGLGLTESAVTMTITPKIEAIRADQADGPVDFYCVSLESKLEATLNQAAFDKLTQALGLGTAAYLSDSETTYEQIGLGGLSAAGQFAVAAIAPKRSDATKVWVGMIYKVISSDGISIQMSRAKPATYKVTFTGLCDLARTAGKQQGIVYETI